MRKPLLLLIFAALLGCEDAIGLGASCTSAMASVRREEGSPDRTPRTSQGGNFTEQWIYLASPGRAGRVYTFRWGVSYENCEVTGPAPLNLLPSGDPSLSAWVLLPSQ